MLLLRVMCILLVKEDELLPFLQLRVMCGRIVANGEMFPLLRVYNCYMERCVLLSSLLRNISTKNENSVIIYSPHVSLMSSEGVFIKTILGNLFNIMKENEEWDCQASKCHKKYKKTKSVHTTLALYSKQRWALELVTRTRVTFL